MYLLFIFLFKKRINLSSDVVQNQYKIDDYIQQNYRIG